MRSDDDDSMPTMSSRRRQSTTGESLSGTVETSTNGMSAGSDAMLLSLLAGQAAMDCEALPIGGWEEVEAWKKVGSCGVITNGRNWLFCRIA